MGANFSAVKTWVDSEVLTAADLNAEFQNVLTNLTPAGIDDESTDITAMQATKDPYSGATAQLPTSLQEEIQELRYMIKQITGKTYWYQDADNSLCPTGSMLIWTTDTAPTGFLLCYGQAINRTTYATLFGVIGTAYGVGDSSTTFNVPDMRGRFPLGQDDMGGSAANRVTAVAADTIASSGGSEAVTSSNHTHTISHTHTVTIGSQHGLENGASAGQIAGDTSTTSDAQGLTSTGTAGTESLTVVNPYLTLNYIIKT